MTLSTTAPWLIKKSADVPSTTSLCTCLMNLSSIPKSANLPVSLRQMPAPMAEARRMVQEEGQKAFQKAPSNAPIPAVLAYNRLGSLLAWRPTDRGGIVNGDQFNAFITAELQALQTTAIDVPRHAVGLRQRDPQNESPQSAADPSVRWAGAGNAFLARFFVPFSERATVGASIGALTGRNADG